jgi:hypothetical protein
MDNLTFIIYKKVKWIVETTNGSVVERKEHTSRTQGINALFNRHTGVNLFHLIIPATDTTPMQNYFFRKSLFNRNWYYNGKEYSSRIKAVRGFLHLHPKLPMFYITIPLDNTTKSAIL